MKNLIFRKIVFSQKISHKKAFPFEQNIFIILFLTVELNIVIKKSVFE